MVSFTSFTQLNRVELNWQTATEVNNYGFEVERALLSATPVKTEFETIGFVEGHGNSNSLNDYSYTDEVLQNGIVQYRLKQIDTDGNFEYFETIEVVIDVPTEFKLSQNYPNPFNPSTTIKYSIPVDTRRGVSPQATSQVTLKIYNMLGQEVATLVNKEQAPGRYEVDFNASQLASGTYIYRIVIGASAGSATYVDTKKIMLLK